ncbi:alpha/beta hydrolase-fold protein [Microbacterium sp.]|uniref:alpha/beta hydrolase-fold protein n=1 Tax=Microbacterium sp. TaxID=51671 RepID=UPI002FE234B2
MHFELRSGRGRQALIALALATALAAGGLTDHQAAQAETRTIVPAEVADAPDPFIRDVQTWLMTSQADRTYKISVALPSGYNADGAPYRVLYVTDANAEFGLAVETARLNAPGTVVVGIGYDNPGQGFTASGVPRTLDLTPTDIGVATPSGGAPEFLSFLRDELVPQIDRDFNVDPGDRALMGHSFGGLFATYTLLHNEGLFQRFVIASPSIWWDDRTILETESEYAAENDALDARVFLSVGSLEETTSGFPMTSDMIGFARTLTSRSYDGLELGAHVFADETHLSVIGAAFSRGIRFIYAVPGTTIPGTSVDDLDEPAPAAPQITTQPIGASVVAGQDATFTAGAIGTPAPTVQWQSKLPDAGDWVAIPDATGSSYTVVAAPASATGIQYRAVFTNATGATTTDAATLIVTADATATADPDGSGDGSSSGGAGAPDRLSETGAEFDVIALTGAAVLLAAGGALLLTRRRRAADGS